eukprot:COSAG04_NODE_3671_length_2617_cov_1.837172_2_plen_61_part_00
MGCSFLHNSVGWSESKSRVQGQVKHLKLRQPYSKQFSPSALDQFQLGDLALPFQGRTKPS